MTLIEELEQAAKDLDVIADAFASPSYGRREKTAAEMHARAARLRKRVEHIKKLEAELLDAQEKGNVFVGICLVQIKRLTGDLP